MGHRERLDALPAVGRGSCLALFDRKVPKTRIAFDSAFGKSLYRTCLKSVGNNRDSDLIGVSIVLLVIL